MAKVEVRPLPQKKWHGKKDKEAFFEPKVYEILLNPDTMQYETGLSEEETALYSKKLGVDLSPSFVEGVESYWNSKQATIKLENKTQYFDTSKALDFIKVKNMKASKFVANSLKEREENKWPEATHVIFDETEEVAMKASKIQKIKKAMAHLNKMSADDQVNIIKILSDKTVKGKSQDFIDAEMGKIIEDKVDEFLELAETDPKDMFNKATVLEALSRNILTKDNGQVYYMGERIGFSTEEAIDWFGNPNNQTIKAKILEKLG
jgi:hypothetical protein